ncbi:MAG: Ig domain-containing protein [Verrucomicrobiae bacterium]|nr:Ig domain-containing protein [Verrucomicrobiae bacterium]
MKQLIWGNLASTIFLIALHSHALTLDPPYEIRGRVKQSLSFQIQYSPTNVPTQFSATDLPTNLNLNTTEGIISGTPLHKTTNLSITITAIQINPTNAQLNATNSQIYTLTIKRRYPKPRITSRLFKSIEIKWDPYHAIHKIDGRYRITAVPAPTNFSVVFPVGKSGNATNSDIAWPEDWPEFNKNRGEIDFYYRETKRRIPVGTFPIKLIVENRAGIATNTLRLEITKKDE